MKKKRFSAVLIAFIVAVGVPVSVCAADLASAEATANVGESVLVSEKSQTAGENSNAAENNDSEKSQESAQITGEASDSSEKTESTGVDDADKEVTEGNTSDSTSDSKVPAQDSEPGGNTTIPDEEPAAEVPSVEEPVVEEPNAEIPATEEPVVEEPVVEEPTVEIPVVEEPELIQEIIPPVEEELVTEPAIVMEETQTATLTVTHRLKLDVGEIEHTETIEGIVFGSDYDVSALINKTEDIKCVSDIKNVEMDELNKLVVLEYEVIKQQEAAEAIQDGSLND